ncbi:hypothetical protein GQ457_13G025400 [Hibiscus cannabinus]
MILVMLPAVLHDIPGHLQRSEMLRVPVLHHPLSTRALASDSDGDLSAIDILVAKETRMVAHSNLKIMEMVKEEAMFTQLSFIITQGCIECFPDQ